MGEVCECGEERECDEAFCRRKLKLMIETLERELCLAHDISEAQTTAGTELLKRAESAEALLEEQKRTIEALLMGVEEHTGKEGTTPVLRFIGDLEAEVERLREGIISASTQLEASAKPFDEACASILRLLQTEEDKNEL